MRRSIILAAAATLAICGALAGCTRSSEGDYESHMSRGATFLDSGDLQKARVEFRNALQLQPRNADARFQNGRVAERLSDPREAVQFYQGALESEPGHAGAAARLGRIMLFNGAPPEKVMETVAPALEAHPGDAALLTVRAAARAMLRDVAGAFQDAELAVKNAPDDEDAVAMLAGLYNSNARSDKAVALLEDAVRRHERSIELRVALAQLYASLDENAKGEALLREVVRLAPQDRAHRVRLAQFVSMHGGTDAAEAAMREAVAALPSDIEMKVALIQFLATRRDRRAAEAELNKMIAADRSNGELQIALARLHVTGGELDRAEAVYRDIIAKHGDDPQGIAARNGLATLRLRAKDVAGTERLVGEVLAASPRDSEALVLRAHAALARGDAKAAIADLRATLRDQPDSVPVLRALATAHAANQEPALAEESLRRALEVNPSDPRSALDMGSFLVAAGKAAQGRTLIERVARERPSDVAAQEALFRANVALRDAAGAKAAADALLAADPKLPIAHAYQGMIAESERQIPAAIAAYDRALALAPAGLEPLQAVTRVLLAEKRPADALKRIDAAVRAAGAGNVQPRIMRAEILTTLGRLPEAEAEFDAAIAAAPTYWIPYRGRALVAAKRGNADKAVEVLRSGLARVEDKAGLRNELAQLFEATGRRDDAIAEYEAILKAAPTSALAANNLALLLVTYRQDGASHARAAAVAKPLADSNEPQFLGTYGWVTFKRGEVETALTVLERANAMAPNTPALQYYLGMVQIAAGQTERARTNLRSALNSGRTFAGVDDARKALAGLGSAS